MAGLGEGRGREEKGEGEGEKHMGKRKGRKGEKRIGKKS